VGYTQAISEYLLSLVCSTFAFCAFGFAFTTITFRAFGFVSAALTFTALTLCALGFVSAAFTFTALAFATLAFGMLGFIRATFAFAALAFGMLGFICTTLSFAAFFGIAASRSQQISSAQVRHCKRTYARFSVCGTCNEKRARQCSSYCQSDGFCQVFSRHVYLLPGF
jgi:hypothetical protein